jgi:hypothetical protein
MNRSVISAATILLLAAALNVSSFGGTVDLSAAEDTWIANGPLFSEINGGTEEFFHIDPAGADFAAGLVRFDLGAIPWGATVTAATLRVYHVYNAQPGAELNIYRISEKWSETTTTGSTAPSYDPAAVATMTIADLATGLYREWDVTALVSGWLTGAYGNFGVMVQKTPNGPTWPYLASRESASGFGPLLTVEYSGGVPPGSATPEPDFRWGVAAFAAAAALRSNIGRSRRDSRFQ